MLQHLGEEEGGRGGGRERKEGGVMGMEGKGGGSEGGREGGRSKGQRRKGRRGRGRGRGRRRRRRKERGRRCRAVINVDTYCTCT